MALENKWMLLQMRPRVIHRIPGRLRIHIPAIKKVHPEYNEIVVSLFTKSHLPNGITQTKVNFITGNVLIHYNQDETNEKNTLKWIFDIKKIAEFIISKFLNQNNNEVKSTKEKLIMYFKDVAKNGKIIDKHFKIPDEIWKKK